MGRILLNWLLMTLVVMAAAYLLPGVILTGFVAALITALILGLANTFVRPILIFLSLPITILTLGLFIFVINALLVMLVAWIVPGFAVASFWWGLAFSLLVSIINYFIATLVE